MPLATPIPATSNSAAPTLPAINGAHGKAASTQEFGALFREKAGGIEASAITGAPAVVAASKAASGSASQKDSEAAHLPASAPMPEPGKNIESLSNEEMQAQPKQSASGGTALPGSSPAQLQPPQSATELEANAKSAANSPLAETIETNLPAMPIASEKTSAAQSKTASLSPQRVTQPEHKAKEAGRSGTQSAENATPLVVTQPLALSIPFSVTKITQSTASASPAERTSAQTGQNQPTNNPNSAQPTGSPVQGVQPVTEASANSAAVSTTPRNASDVTAHASAGPGDSSKTSSESVAAVVHPSHASVGQPATSSVTGPTVIAATIEAHPASAESAASQPAAATPAAGPSVNSAAAPPASLYDKIDQGNLPVVLHSGAQQVTVGVRDPSLGWVEIKTQNNAGHIDATLIASSSQTHDSLAAQLPAMAQYLQERDVRVGTLAVQHPMTQANVGGGQNGNPGNGSNPHAGGGGAQAFSQSGSGHEGNAARYSGVMSGSSRSSSSPGMGGVIGNPIEETGSSLRPVSYISVRA